jgi:hypothetical protein
VRGKEVVDSNRGVLIDRKLRSHSISDTWDFLINYCLSIIWIFNYLFVCYSSAVLPSSNAEACPYQHYPRTVHLNYHFKLIDGIKNQIYRLAH